MSLTKVTNSMISGAAIQIMDYIPAGTVTASVDCSSYINAALVALAAQGHGKLVGANGVNFRIDSTIDFSVLGGLHIAKEVDFCGAEFTWYGSQVAADPMFYFYNNKMITVKNFTLFCNPVLAISATVKGIFVDSLQPLGSDLLVFSDFRIRLASICIDLGSVGIDQNRVSESRFEHFLLEGSTVGVQTNSTNCDTLVFTNAQLSGCAYGFNFVRAGFNKIDSCIGYACDPFILVGGAIGPLTVINSQSEEGGLTDPAFLYRKNYVNAKTGTITLIGCNIDNHIYLDYDVLVGSDVQRLDIIGGYFRKMTVNAPDTVVNLIGTVQTTGYTLTLSGVNTKCYNFGSGIYGTLTDIATPKGYRVYEEGTFTPTVVGTTSAGTATYVTQVGSYTLDGDTVYFQINLNYSAGNGTGNLRVLGLPYTSGANATLAFGAVTVGYSSGLALTASNYLTAYVVAASTEIGFANNPVGGGVVTAVAYDGEAELVLSGQYKI